MPANVIKIGPLGPYANNAYIIVDPKTKRSIFVDAPIGSEEAVAAAKGTDVQMIIVTHRHGDHWANIDLVKKKLGAPVFCHDADRAPYKDKVFDTLGDGDEIPLGESRVKIIHTPGHTPGSICLLVETADGPVLMSGDTLFPGGPGRSDKPADLLEMVGSIEEKLLLLDEATAVYPGHGGNTTIANSRREHAVFASKPHPADLCGDVTWEST
jgi:glyoxylase-like metal-dependent hydrolase (beta-lactamase superfamily II)